MKRLLDLRVLFVMVAALEAAYFVSAMMPPSMVRTVTGWNLGPDGHWVTKLLGIALGTQAYVAWIFRRTPHLGVAKALAFYQVASATMDWAMWLVMDGIFDNALARTTVSAAIASHYALGVLLIAALRRGEITARA